MRGKHLLRLSALFLFQDTAPAAAEALPQGACRSDKVEKIAEHTCCNDERCKQAHYRKHDLRHSLAVLGGHQTLFLKYLRFVCVVIVLSFVSSHFFY